MNSTQDSYNFLVGALEYLDPKKLELSDSDLEYIIFEELDIDAISFLHESTVNEFIISNKIPVSLRESINDLRTKIIGLIEYNHKVEFYRNSPEWHNVRIHSMKILKEIKGFQTKSI